MTNIEEEDVEEFLAHFGVLGMKWGVRKDRERTDYEQDRDNKRKIKRAELSKARASKKAAYRAQQAARPTVSKTRAIAGGLVMPAIGLGSKARYTDPQALKKRTSAGKLALAAFLTGVGSGAVSSLGALSKNPTVNVGSQFIGQLGGTAAFGLGIGSIVNNVKAIDQERYARAKKDK